MKKLISLLLAAVLAVSFAACSGKTENDTQTTSAQTETQSQSGQAESTSEEEVKSKKVSLTVPVMETDDWSSYEFTEYEGKDEVKINLSVPEDYTLDSTIIYDKSKNKVGEISGIVVYKNGQEPFDTIEANDTYNNIKYIEKQGGEIGEGDNARVCYLVISQVPSDDGQSVYYSYGYAVDFGNYCVRINLNSNEDLETMPSEHSVILSNITVE